MTANLDARIALHARCSTAETPWPVWLYDQVDPQDGETVIEVGAGTGMLWSCNAGRLPSSVRLHLSDLSPAMCRALPPSLPARADASVVRADAQRLPYATGVADVVVANHVLYHVPDRLAALTEMRRVLRPGGRAIIATNGRDHLREVQDLLAAAGIGVGERAPHRAFTLEDGVHVVEQVFAEIRTVRFEDSLHVTDGEPLVAYLLSMAAVPADGAITLPALVRELLTRDGLIEISKSSGVFVAW